MKIRVLLPLLAVAFAATCFANDSQPISAGNPVAAPKKTDLNITPAQTIIAVNDVTVTPAKDVSHEITIAADCPVIVNALSNNPTASKHFKVGDKGYVQKGGKVVDIGTKMMKDGSTIHFAIYTSLIGNEKGDEKYLPSATTVEMTEVEWKALSVMSTEGQKPATTASDHTSAAPVPAKQS